MKKRKNACLSTRTLTVLLLLSGILLGATAGLSAYTLASGRDVTGDLGGLACLLLAALSATMVIVLLAFVLRRSAEDRETLRALGRAAQRLSEGRHDGALPACGSAEVAALAEEFNRMAESLRTLEKEKNTFTAAVVHDLRAPMTSIAGFVDAILAGSVPKDKERTYLETVSRETKRLSRMVSDLLEFERLLAGERKFEMCAFDLCETARQVLLSFERRIEEKALEVSFSCEPDRISVLADPDAARRVLYNLCDNAVKFSKTGGRLALSVGVTEGRATCSVCNEGEGIAPDELPHVFDRFYTKRPGNPSGVGLGLAVARELVEAHGTEITASSDYGKSCTFTFSLPLSAR